MKPLVRRLNSIDSIEEATLARSSGGVIGYAYVREIAKPSRCELIDSSALRDSSFLSRANTFNKMANSRFEGSLAQRGNGIRFEDRGGHCLCTWSTWWSRVHMDEEILAGPLAKGLAA
jgi:hypothetical protein